MLFARWCSLQDNDIAIGKLVYVGAKPDQWGTIEQLRTDPVSQTLKQVRVRWHASKRLGSWSHTFRLSDLDTYLRTAQIAADEINQLQTQVYTHKREAEKKE